MRVQNTILFLHKRFRNKSLNDLLRAPVLFQKMLLFADVTIFGESSHSVPSRRTLENFNLIDPRTCAFSKICSATALSAVHIVLTLKN